MAVMQIIILKTLYILCSGMFSNHFLVSLPEPVCCLYIILPAGFFVHINFDIDYNYTPEKMCKCKLYLQTH